ncbi:MAG: 50S ribosomal protein L10 [Prevotellaceae bacterium]|nr:50S ribosomal protein L10 [Prevotellaceae bacterium]MCD8303931.1 50S ribosomal protein L10 [Prevotellaceae bacterium]
MRKEDKQAIVAQFGKYLQDYPHFYLVDVEGMNSEITSSVRRKCFQKEIKLVVVKNTLLHKALEATDVDFSGLYDVLKGATAVMFTQTANAPAKLLKELKTAKVEKPELKAAYAEEGIYVGSDKLDALCSIKSKNEVIADIVALLQSPAKNVLSALQSGQNIIHGVLKTLGEREG